VPKLWSDTIETHRNQVRDAVIETAAALVAKHGLRAVTMSQIAQDAGIGRATLYKYFPDVEAILVAWHERHVSEHLDHLDRIRDRHADPMEALRQVIHAYALITHEVARQNHGADLTALVHAGAHIDAATQRLTRLIEQLIAEAARKGQLRSDVAPGELAAYCLHALGAASSVTSKAAVNRLVTVTLAGLQADQNR
jgi:AcrR family transcriptional regulator